MLQGSRGAGEGRRGKETVENPHSRTMANTQKIACDVVIKVRTTVLK